MKTSHNDKTPDTATTSEKEIAFVTGVDWMKVQWVIRSVEDESEGDDEIRDVFVEMNACGMEKERRVNEEERVFVITLDPSPLSAERNESVADVELDEIDAIPLRSITDPTSRE